MRCIFLKLFVLVFLASAAFRLQVFACTRYGTPPYRVAFQDAEIVFSGKITKIKKLKSKEVIPDNWKELTFEVTNGYKGVKTKTVKVFTADYGTCEGIEVKAGESWLIFAVFNTQINTVKKTQGFEQFRAYRVGDENKDVIDIVEKASKNLFPSELNIEIANAVNPYDRYRNSVKLKINGENFEKEFTIKEGFFSIEDLPAGKYTLEFHFKSKVFYEGFEKVVLKNKTPTVIELAVDISENEMNFVYLEAIDNNE